MAEPQIIKTLSRKRDELEALIDTYKAKVQAAQYELLHVNATIALFEQHGDPNIEPSVWNISRIFKKGEMFRMCKEALAETPNGMDTRELALAVMRRKGLDEKDTVLRKMVGYRVMQNMRLQCARGKIGDGGRQKGMRVWKLSQTE